MKFEWKNEMSVGIGEIDADHREIIKRIDILEQVSLKMEQNDIIIQTVNSMKEYAEKHFNTEEMYMITTAYPRYKEHKQEHIDFLDMMKKMVDEINSGKLIGKEVEKHSTYIYNWFVNHIEDNDVKMGEYLKSKMKK